MPDSTDRTALEELSSTFSVDEELALPPEWTSAAPWVGNLRKVKGVHVPKKSGTLLYIQPKQRVLRLVFATDVERFAIFRVARESTSYTIVKIWPCKSEALIKRFERRFLQDRITWGWFTLSQDIISYLKG